MKTSLTSDSSESFSSESASFRVWVNGETFPTVRLFTAEGFGYKKLAVNYVHALGSQPVSVTVTTGVPIRSFEVSPRTEEVEVFDSELKLVLAPFKKCCVRINQGGWLFLFIDPADSWRPGLQAPDTISIDLYEIDKSGRHLETDKLQRAINDAASLGKPATVFLPPGIYRTGSLHMKTNVTLYLDAGALLLGDENDLSYPERRYAHQTHLSPATDPKIYASLIWFDGVENSAIRGRGAIDGQGSRRRDIWRSEGKKARHRTNNIRVVDSTNITIEGITIRDSEFWAIHLLRSHDLKLQNLKVVNEMVYKGWDIQNPDSNWNNTDGIDPDSCSEVLVEDSFVYAGDDSLVLKTTNSAPDSSPACENIAFRRCLLAASTAAIKFGTESVGPAIRNIEFEDIVIMPMNVGQNIGFVARDTAHIEHITFRKLRIENRERWLGIQIQSRTPDQATFASVRHLVFEDVELPAECTGRLIGRENTDLLGDLRFSDIKVAGKQACAIEDLGLTISHVTNLTFASFRNQLPSAS